MNPRIRVSEPRKKPGIAYVVSDDGVELPVIDLTHPAFEVAEIEARLPESAAAFIADTRRREKLPKFVGNLVMKIFLRGSVLGGSLQRASGSFLPGMSTYLFKLGADNLGPYAKPIDRQIAASLPAVSMRLRLADMARLLTEGVAPALDEPGRPLLLANIGGGPCIDSLNALLMIRKSRPEALRGRSVKIVALDLQAEGPSFGARALEALRAEGAPLAGLDVQLHHARYDWTRPKELASLLGPQCEPGAFVAVSSEGALFEYADDPTVEANLRALRDWMPNGGCVVGSVTSDSETAKMLQKTSTVQLQARSEDAFRALAERAGWKLSRMVDRPLSRDGLLVPA